MRLLLLLGLCFLWTFSPVEATRGSHRIDPDLFEREAEKERYQSSCCIRGYDQDDQLITLGNGTFCQLPQQEKREGFILSISGLTSYFDKRISRHTVMFDDGVEIDLLNFRPLTSTDNSMTLAVGFLKDIPHGITPAILDFSKSKFDHTSAVLAGYGDRVSPYSDRNTFWFDENRRFKKTAFTLTIDDDAHFKSRALGVNGVVTAEFKGFGQPDSTRLEHPVPMGFEGSGLRDDKSNNIIGVAAGTTHYFATEEFREEYPWSAWILQKSGSFIFKYPKSWYYWVPAFGIGTGISYGISGYLGWGSMLATLASSFLAANIPTINEVIWYDFRPKGTQSHFTKIADWFNDIVQVVIPPKR